MEVSTCNDHADLSVTQIRATSLNPPDIRHNPQNISLKMQCRSRKKLSFFPETITRILTAHPYCWRRQVLHVLFRDCFKTEHCFCCLQPFWFSRTIK